MNDHESIDEAPRVLLIDLENCPNQINQLQKNLEQFSQVIICYAQSGAKIPIDWLIPLSTNVNNNKLQIFKMVSSGKNAADFGICFFAGVLMQQLPEKTHFVIISNDTDLDHVVSLLKSQGRSAERVGIVSAEKEEKQVTNQGNNYTTYQGTNNITSLATVKPSIIPAVKTYCLHLITYSTNRPAKRDTLVKSINNKFSDTLEIAEEVLKSLISLGAVTITESKVSYNDKKIKELTNS